MEGGLIVTPTDLAKSAADGGRIKRDSPFLLQGQRMLFPGSTWKSLRVPAKPLQIQRGLATAT